MSSVARAREEAVAEGMWSGVKLCARRRERFGGGWGVGVRTRRRGAGEVVWWGSGRGISTDMATGGSGWRGVRPSGQ